jgi:hypothetical protein
MSILSIDIGIKNLALCILNKNKKIIYWEVLNISTIDTKPTVDKLCCSYCKNNAKYSKLENHYCIKHSKLQKEYFIPTGDLVKKKINKYTLTQLQEIMDKYKIEYDKTINKKKHIEVLTNKLLDGLDEKNDKKISEYNLIDISRILTIKLDNVITPYLLEITDVLIENQISPIANRMKSIQSMVTQYLVMRCNQNTNIKYVSAMNKLKGITTTSYTERKKVGIEKCKELLVSSDDVNTEWLEYFNKHKKKDDLSDCYIQCMWYMNKNV